MIHNETRTPRRVSRSAAILIFGAVFFAALSLPASLFASGASEKSSTGGTSAGSGSTGSQQTSNASYNPDATIDIGSLYEPQNLDNTAGGGQGVTQALQGNVYEGLFKLADDGSVENLLAKDYTVSDDGLTYTFQLRSGVSFHSGAAVTAADVKYSIDRYIGSDSKASRKSALSPIDSVSAPNDSTVVVKLSFRSISLPYNLTYVWIVNPKDGDPATTADGTGPYKVADWRHGSTLTLERYDGYWGSRPKNKRVVFHYFTDATALNNALLTGSIDIITSIQSPDLLSQFTGTKSFTVKDGHSTTKLVFAFNDRVKPFDNVQVRKAVSMAIDDKKLLTSIWGNYGMLIGSFVPPTDPWYEDLTSVNAYDPTGAKQLLADAGYADGFTFTLDTPNYSPHPIAAEFIKGELAKVGITVKINIITANEWYTKVYQAHNFQATLQEHVNNRDIVFYGDPNFYWGYDNPEVTKLISSAESGKTVQERNDKLRKANEIIARDAASDWLYLYPQIVVSRATVSGYPLNQLDSRFFAYDITKQ